MALPNRMGPRASATFAATLLIGVAGLAMADDNEPAKVLESLKGTWVSAEPFESKWTFEGENLKASVNGMDYTCKVKADPKAKPATLDFMINEGPDEAKGTTSKCIYKLEDGKLTMCVSLPGKDRPKEFEGVEGESFLFELKKEKPKATEEKKKD